VNDEMRGFIKKVRHLFDELPPHYGFIGYVFDHSPKGEGIAFSKNANQGDAFAAIATIAECFHLDREKLFICLIKAEEVFKNRG